MPDWLMAISLLMVMLASLALALKAAPGLYAVVAGSDTVRLSTLDGLRGVLAVSVFSHHCLAMRDLARTGDWTAPAGNVTNLMGEGAVAVFFMISAFLFVGKIGRSSGRLDLRAFVLGRLLRILPLSLFMSAVSVAIVLAASGFRLHVPFPVFLDQLPGWFGSGFMHRPDLNEVPHSSVMISPTWSLRYEWMLYATIPVLAFLLRRGLPLVLVGVAFLLLGLADRWFVFFGLGTFALLLLPRRLPLPDVALAWAAALALVLLALTSHSVTTPPGMVLSFVIFVAALKSETLGALLRLPALQYAGHVSFSVYLMHMPILFVVTRIMMTPQAAGAMSDWAYAALCVATGIVVMAISTLTFLLIERPAFAQAPRGQRSLAE